ncbi:MAG: ABC transporter ATP-binding protein [Polyangiales bacterium]
MRLKVTGLGLSLGGRRVLDGVDLALDAGVVALRGDNGSGKTTLLNALAGLVSWDDGEIEIVGRSLARDRVALRSVGWVPERSDAPDALTGREVVELVAALRSREAGEAEIDRFGLRDVYDVRRDAVSLGQRRRADLLAAFVGSPPVLLLDEPTNGLDAATTRWLAERLRAHADGGGLALVATHDAAFVEACADRSLRMRAGRVS